jgi:hypothetical protein
VRHVQRSVPEPVRNPEPRAVPATPRRRRGVRTTLLAAIAVIVVAVAIAVPFLTRRTGPDLASVPLRLSVFDHRVPLGPVAAGALGDTPLVHPGEGSLAATVENHQVFLVEAAGDRVCIVIVRENYGSAATGCDPLTSMLTQGVVVYTNFSFDGSGPGMLFVAVPDGYTRATLGGRRTSIANNLAVVPVVPDDRALRISGPEVPTATLDLDRFLPPGFPAR